MKPNFYKTTKLEETQRIAFDLAKSLRGGDILCLYGELGSGKTTFVQGLAKGLGVNKRIISPTFIIARQYKLKHLTFYHIDLYRTRTYFDLQSIGMEEILEDTNNIVAIEWAEKLGDMKPVKRVDLKFQSLENDTREIVIENYE